MDAEAAEKLIADYSEVSLAGYLSPRQSVVAGSVAQIDAVIVAVSAQERFARRVNMEVASHTALMDPILTELRSALADLKPTTADDAFISTVADPATTPTLDADYWVDNVRHPCCFTRPSPLLPQSHATFIEISPHPPLTHAITDTLESVHHHSIGTLSRKGDDTVSFHTNLNSTHVIRPRTRRIRPSRTQCCRARRGTTLEHWISRRGNREGSRVGAATRYPARSAHPGRRDAADAPVAGAPDVHHQAVPGLASQQRRRDHPDIGSAANTFDGR